MELKLEHGDYVRCEAGTLERLSEKEALAQRVRIRLTVSRGRFPFWESLGSRLYLLGRVPPCQQSSAAKQYVTEALADEEVTVEEVQLQETGDGGGALEVLLRYNGELVSSTVPITL